MEKKVQNTHGGKRVGSGRKPRDTVQLSLKIPKELLARLDKKYPLVKNRNKKIIEILSQI